LVHSYASGGKREGQIPAEGIAAFIAVVLAVAGLALLPFTGSKGGTALGAGVAVAILAGGLAWRQAMRWRSVLIGAGVGLLVVAAAGVVGYGVRHDALPSKSLLFRWHYWTASAPMIREHAAFGVGLNNFGDYYLAYKRPSSPEDVKDPHNYFVRIAAEMGVPAAVFAGGLVVWMMAGALRRAGPREELADGQGSRGPFIALCCVVAFAWALLHLMFFEAAVEFNVYITGLLALLALGVFAATMIALRPPTAGAAFPVIRYAAIAAVIGGLGMMIYDQINMALVTGPVAMLFWMMLGVGDSFEAIAPPLRRVRALRAAGFAMGAVAAAAALVVVFGLWSPILRGAMPWDPGPDEAVFLRDWNERDFPGALAALDRAITKSPRNLDLQLKRIGVLKLMQRPVAEAIRGVFALDHANAGVRINLAPPESDLPAAERIAVLREALEFDAALPADEYKRLSPEKVEEVKGVIARLEAGG
jgi:hypothetical protein